jgi:serine/threonine-protein kinase
MSQPEIAPIGKYQIVEQVGEGAMGVVYRAMDPVLNRPVAIKVMSEALARNDDLRDRFLREAQAAGSLQHPNVVTVYDFGEVNGHLYIAMEFVDGEDLEALLQKKVSLSIGDKLDIVIDVLSGLAYAHKHGVVHRDIKPANIRIDEEGRARIMDFGIAHLSSSNLTRTGVMVGTPAYMAPEQIVGGGVSPATDIFSVGAVLYELITGEKPFAGDSLQTVMYKIVSAPNPPLPTKRLGLPTELGAVVDRALAKEAGDRYPAAQDMANALTAVRASLERATTASVSVPLRSVIDTALAERRATAEHAAHKRESARRGVALAGLGVGVAGVALAAVVILRQQTPSRTPSQTTPISNPPAAVSEASASPPPTASSPAPETKQQERPGGTSPKSAPVAPPAANTRRVTPTQQVVPKDQKAGAASPASDAIALVRGLQSTSIESRRRAVAAGATSDQLRSGDESNRAADTLIARGRLSEAAAKLNDAAASWSVAERDARAAASAAEARGRAAANDSPKTDPPAATPPTASVAAPPPAKLPAASARTEIEVAIAAYARAIESRDIAEVRRAYPSITQAQATGFEQFFASVRSLKATFSLSSLDVSGNAAEGKLAGTYEYVTSTGNPRQQQVAFQATFRREAGGWKLASVR